MTSEEALQFLVAAWLVVAPCEVPRHEFRTGRELWDWVVTASPIAALLVGALDQEQRAVVQDVLTGMLRERLQAAGGR